MAWFNKKREARGTDVVFYEGMDILEMSRNALKKALQIKELDTSGSKKMLRLRLMESVQREMEEEQAYRAAVLAARRAEAALEESGSVYTVGLNNKGQLGQGDLEPRDKFTVIRSSRGKRVDQVYAGDTYVFALTVDSDVYVWGGKGKAPLGLEGQDEEYKAGGTRKASQTTVDSDADEPDDIYDSDEDKAVRAVLARVVKYDAAPEGAVWMTPYYLESMRGEGIVQIGVGYNHVAAVSDGGDMYTWGAGRHGQLGHADFDDQLLPKLNLHLQKVRTQLAAVGFQHSACITEDGRLLTWGHGHRGRLGIGTNVRKGVKPPFNRCFPEPTLVPTFLTKKVKQIAVSTNHCICIAEDGVYTWGSGDGGRLGHGDLEDRVTPDKVAKLDGEIILQVACGNWHSAALVQVPPYLHGGTLMTWGSGYKGQLGHKKKVVVWEPKPVEWFLRRTLTVAFVTCSSYHMAVLTDDEQMYTWGDNREGCLGTQQRGEFYDEPQKVWAFDVMIDGVGRGPPRSIACGSHFTVVALHEYTGPSEAELIAEERKVAAEAELERLAEAEEQLLREEIALAKKRADKLAAQAVAAGSAGAKCTVCNTCKGFEPDIFKPKLCNHCGHPKGRHQ